MKITSGSWLILSVILIVSISLSAANSRASNLTSKTKPNHATAAVTNKRLLQVAGPTKKEVPVLGRGYKTEQDQFVGNCVDGEITTVSIANATATLDAALKNTKASDVMGFNASARARYGAIAVSGSVNIFKESVSDEFSISALWLSEYETLSKTFGKKENFTELTKKLTERGFNETCGDEYVREIVEGGRLLINLRFTFASSEIKEKFEAIFSFKSPPVETDIEYKQFSERYSRDTRITVTAKQLGGDASKLTGLFGSSPGAKDEYVKCTLGDYKNCASVLGNIIEYAKDTKAGFPSQLAPNSGIPPYVLSSKTAKYTNLGKQVINYPYLTEVTIQARERLDRRFEEEFRSSVIGDRLLELKLLGEQTKKIKTEKEKADANVTKLLSASKTCYDNPSQCKHAVDSTLKMLAKVNDKVFVLPDSPTGSFRFMSSQDDIYDRQRSVDIALNKDILFVPIDVKDPGSPSIILNPQNRCWIDSKADLPKEDSSKSCKMTLHSTLVNLANKIHGSASVGLRIQGTGLVEAKLYFESKFIVSYSLIPTSNSDPSKFGPNWVFLVFETTRAQEDFLDVDIDRVRRVWWNPDTKSAIYLPEADGVFYFIVTDKFGQESRIDLEYQKFKRTVEKATDSSSVVTESLELRNRWFDPQSEGITTKGPGSWSLIWKSTNRFNTK
jgi:hypothetical protein